MSLSVKFPKTETKTPQNIILCVFSKAELGTNAAKVDKKLNGFITRAIKNNAGFKGENGQVLHLGSPSENEYATIILLGLGKLDELTLLKCEEAGGKLCAAIKKSGYKNAGLIAEKTKDLNAEIIAAHIANGFALRHYDFDRYKSKKDAGDNTDKTPDFKTLNLITPDQSATKKAYDTLDKIAQGTFFARDLVNTAPNDLYPDSYAKLIRSELKPLGVEVEIYDDKKLEKLGMGAIVAVGQGSARKPRMVIMRWNGAAKKTDKPLGFVGKGVTFDTGGISIKPGAGMDEMKMDMGGSAAVVGLMKTLALRKAKCNVVAIVGLAENMPSSTAYRPGDIITSYAGKTIEVLNTDAEGRLVLADCLTHIQNKYKPEFVINLATLTGAMMVALGHEYCGSFVNNDDLWGKMDKASKISGEKLWRMPLDKVWSKEVESGVADLRNLGKSRYAGACTAAAFLGHFIDKDTKWAHMDIAGTAWRMSDQPTVPKFGSGFGVRVLNDLVAEFYE